MIIDAPFSSLYRLSSDIPRLCCLFKTAHSCRPPFPLFVSCTNLITSKALILFGWLIGLSTPILSLFSLCLLVYKLYTPETQLPRVVMLYSMNLNLAELVTSLCLLSYSVINVAFHDEFGIYADHWRHSLKCLSLESFFLLSSRASLAFAVCLSIHFAIHIPSVIPRKTSQTATIFQIIIMWFVITSICITVQVLEKIRNTDPYNYFCFPFTTIFPSDPLILSLQIVLLMFDILLIIVSMASHGYLLAYTIRRSQNKTLQSVGKRKERLQKLAKKTNCSHPEHFSYLDTYSLCSDFSFVENYCQTKHILLVYLDKFSNQFDNRSCFTNQKYVCMKHQVILHGNSN